ncbi:putative fatty acyl-CoA reductase CG5065 isoform X2 [Limulus polyphemus]|uniref:Fatty acyl-CoA reductase n=1 Tax=Limulus polyphemus TaxID=6850 RepID=A0ABM1BNG8_LIMPO|nr:putative fatty acyl-CoA reductase CG5065 isoform X2 [Limulus polyphemus]
MAEEDTSPIAAFYQDRAVLITGATGFMGKVLVEKLLRCCGGIKTIYVLLRSKGGQKPRERLEELLNAKIFDDIRKNQPHQLSKLVPIHGDITLPGLGICPSDVTLLAGDVSVVFHSAATVKFDEPLKCSVEMNILGTRRLVELCHKIPHLVALIHVSTAYCNCDRDEVDEIVYPPPANPQKVIDALEWMDEDMIASITPKLLGDRPNTYTYTKALAENLLVEECGSLPVAIVRPSIVAAAWKEPLPGWIDNFNGPTGLIVATGKGVLRSMLCRPCGTADIIPVDVVIKLIISVAWYTATQRPNNIMIYNCTSGSQNRLSWREVESTVFSLVNTHPSREVLRYPGGSFKSNRLWNQIYVFIHHQIPAHLLDFAARLMGRKPRMVQLYSRLNRAINCLEYFTTHEWVFHNSNVQTLYKQLVGKDKETFDFSIKNLDWPKYFEDYVLGSRKYLLKEDPSTLPAARRSLRRLYVISQLVNFIFLLGLWRILIMRSAAARRLWWFFLSTVVRSYRLLPSFLT